MATGHRSAELPAAERVMLDFAARLTRAPGSIEESDLDPLRRYGFGDAEIHDIVQVVALFNYYNRLADGLGIDPEPEWSDRAAGGRASRGRR